MTNQQDVQHEEDHTGPVKTPKQMLQLVFFSFVLPIFMIIGLVYYVVNDAKPASVSATADKSQMALGGLTDQERTKALEGRISKIGTVEIVMLTAL